MASIGPQFGLLREGTLRRVFLNRGTILVALNLAKSDNTIPAEYEVPLPGSWMGPNGEFGGGFPQVGATVWLAQGEGGQWVPVTYAPSNDIFRNRNTLTQSGFDKNRMVALRDGRWLNQTDNNIRVFVDPLTGFEAGGPIELIRADPTKSIYSNTFHQQYEFSTASRKITGVIKRDLVSNSNRNITGSALTSHIYEDSLTEIGLDPLTKTGLAFVRNPPFVENREIVYEFSNEFGFTDDTKETTIYDNDQLPEISTSFDRRQSRSDTLSLSLIAPNFLMEHTKGTVIDIYGNILDINRAALPSGQIDKLSFRTNEENKSDTFTSLREQARKSIAMHYELNARKQLPTKDINDPQDYARDRSRLSVDVDKEGLFKVNIPMSSEVGNVPLLTRYENYSTLLAVQNDSDPNEFVRNVDNQDIFLENFAIGAVELKGGDQSLTGFAAPTDRLTGDPIKLGTPYHDIAKTIQLHQLSDPIFFYPDSLINDATATPPVKDVVTSSVVVSGPNANAGGRSGTINLDGFISLNIGANTVDRQSMWLDMAGGVVANIGRDVRGVSYACTMDGDLLLQVGGFGISTDSRFNKQNNAARNGTVDVRVFSDSSMHIFRISTTGVQLLTPGRVDIVAEQTLRLKSVRGDIVMDAENIFMYGDSDGRGRLVLRKAGQTI